MRMLISPRRWVLFSRFFSFPPSSMRRSATFSCEWPKIDGASDSKASGQFFLSRAQFLTSSLVNVPIDAPFVLWARGCPRPSPGTCRSSSPWTAARGRRPRGGRGARLYESTRSFSRRTSTERGSCPAALTRHLRGGTVWWSRPAQAALGLQHVPLSSFEVMSLSLPREAGGVAVFLARELARRRAVVRAPEHLLAHVSTW